MRKMAELTVARRREHSSQQAASAVVQYRQCDSVGNTDGTHVAVISKHTSSNHCQKDHEHDCIQPMLAGTTVCAR